MMLRFRLGEHARLAYSMNPAYNMDVGHELVIERIGPFPSGTRWGDASPGTNPGWENVRNRNPFDYVVLMITGPSAGIHCGVADQMLIKLTDPDAGLTVEESKELTV